MIAEKVKYKRTGIDWMPEVPEHWQLWKVSRAFNIIGSGTTPESGNLRYYNNGTINWVVTGDLNDDLVQTCENKITRAAFERHSALKIFPKGTLLVAMYGATIGKTGLLDFDACTNQACCALGGSEVLLTKFVYYWFFLNRPNVVRLSYGGGQPNISQDVIMQLRIQTPTIEEQERIVSFLDSQSAKITHFIRTKQRFIALLKEQRQSIITHAVTKGIDDEVKMKDSGVEWIGEVPEHWEVRRLGTIGRFSKGGNISRSELTHSDDGIAAILYGDLYTKYDIVAESIINRISEKTAEKSIMLQKGDLLFTGSGETKEDIGKCVIFHSVEPTYAGGDVIIFKQNIFDSYFISYSQNSSIAKYQKAIASKGEIIVHTYGSKLRDVIMPYPPTIEEQQKIVAYIKAETRTIDIAISKAEREIELMKEYREAMIAEAVMGRMEITEGK